MPNEGIRVNGRGYWARIPGHNVSPPADEPSGPAGPRAEVAAAVEGASESAK